MKDFEATIILYSLKVLNKIHDIFMIDSQIEMFSWKQFND